MNDSIFIYFPKKRLKKLKENMFSSFAMKTLLEMPIYNDFQLK